jgi:hypothetical protein
LAALQPLLDHDFEAITQRLSSTFFIRTVSSFDISSSNQSESLAESFHHFHGDMTPEWQQTCWTKGQRAAKSTVADALLLSAAACLWNPLPQPRAFQ